MELEKRTWWYLRNPITFGIANCDKCGNPDGLWSEYKGHIWCQICQIDFIPRHNGIFDGPIPVGAAHLLGVSFDRWNDEFKIVQKFNIDTGEYEPPCTTNEC